MTHFHEHRVHATGGVYVREYPGAGPAFVLLHGFPDNGHIYDDLIPQLVAGGRRAITIDFLGFGTSDKPERAQCSVAQRRGDVEAVRDGLGLETVVPADANSSPGWFAKICSAVGRRRRFWLQMNRMVFKQGLR